MFDSTISPPPPRRAMPRRNPLPPSQTAPSAPSASATLQLVSTGEEGKEGRRKFVKGAPLIPSLLGQHQSDHGNAERLIALFGADLRYCHTFRKWLIWDGQRWSIDDAGKPRYLARLAMVEFYHQALCSGSEDKRDFASLSLNNKAITALLKMAESEPELIIRPADLDTDPYLLNFLNGTVDLRTGVMRPHRRENYITKLVHYNYHLSAKCPQWHVFLKKIQRGNQKVLTYLQRAIGYSLTAITREKAAFVLIGPRDTGKTTLLATVRELIKEYTTLVQIQTLMVMREENNNSQADAADLCGVRFAMTSEADKGQRLSQGKLKRMTQGQGDIRACRKYENPFSFRETHKLWMDTNSKPEVSDEDGDATFNRLHAIPFDVQIPKEEIDRDLPAKLLGEAEGILAWAVAGAKLWYEHGLGKPPEVEAAVEEWRAESDHLEPFIDARCESGGSATGNELFKAYKKWAESVGEERILSQNEFGSKMGQRAGIAKSHTDRGNVYAGIQLKPIKFTVVAKLDRSKSGHRGGLSGG